MENLPLEIVCHIGSYLTRFRDRAALCSVSRTLNMQTTPLLYQHTVIELDNTMRPRSKPEYSPVWLTQLRGLHRNREALCPAVKKLSILFRDESDAFERGERLAMELLLGCVCEMHSLEEVMYELPRDQILDGLSNALIELFRWAANPIPPESLMEAFAAKKITSFAYDGDPRVTKLASPLDVLNLEILSQCPLRSLSIKASTEPELLA
ncbi:hypothetical protein ACJ72_06053 [Emergomyces africanus]|uniref:F-box domain-containing protein n=1 Tax=Emergomyces africanus TaxID=1955775 RepID=A0A1B7NS68_9EURO|nr:hypothetical protein ACJ72_06053 [Emergomyces africanus]